MKRGISNYKEGKVNKVNELTKSRIMKSDAYKWIITEVKVQNY